jgi:hypothetical protein
MQQASSEAKWRRYERALLRAMGCERFPEGAARAEYRLLIIPTFHAPGCLRLVLGSPIGELSLSLLAEHSAAVFEAVWRGDAAAEAQAVQSAGLACRADLYELPAPQVAALHQQLAALDPLSLDDLDHTGRDGITLRCDCFEQGRQHSLAISSPTARDAPRHHALAALLLDAARECVEPPEMQQYLSDVRGYLIAERL